MHILVNRFVSDEDTTLSTIFIDGKFQSFGLEDEYREDKVVGETRIPAGTYKVSFRNWGGFYELYKKRFPNMHDEGMLQIMDVPGFTNILIHMGNTDEDTAGCLVVGEGAHTAYKHKSVSNSRVAYLKLYSIVWEALLLNEQVEIEFVDSDLT